MWLLLLSNERQPLAAILLSRWNLAAKRPNKMRKHPNSNLGAVCHQFSHSAASADKILIMPQRDQSTKLQQTRAMRGWVIDDLTNFFGHFRERICTVIFSETGVQSILTWERHRPIIGAFRVCFKFHICCSVSKHRGCGVCMVIRKPRKLSTRLLYLRFWRLWHCCWLSTWVTVIILYQFC